MEGYTKLFAGITKSTKWCGPDATLEGKVLWITLMANADENGDVTGFSIPGLAKEAGISIEACVKALEVFKAPDPWSTTKEFDGRSIEEIDRGWHLLNHAKYRALRSKDEKREADRLRVAEKRSTEKPNDSDSVAKCRKMSQVSQNVANVAQAEEEADSKAKAIKTPSKKSNKLSNPGSQTDLSPEVFGPFGFDLVYDAFPPPGPGYRPESRTEAEKVFRAQVKLDDWGDFLEAYCYRLNDWKRVGTERQFIGTLRDWLPTWKDEKPQPLPPPDKGPTINEREEWTYIEKD